MAKAAQKKPPTKTEVFTSIANATDLTKKDVAAVFDALSAEIKRSVGRNGPKAFTSSSSTRRQPRPGKESTRSRVKRPCSKPNPHATS